MISKAILRTGAIAAVMAIMVFGFSACSQDKTAKGGGAAADRGAGPGQQGAITQQVYAVSSSTAAQGKIEDYLGLSGDIVASSTVDTYSDIAGKVSKIYVAIGSRIQKGAPVAEVDPSRPGMDYVPSLVKAPLTGIVVTLPAQLGMTVSPAVSLARIAGGTGLEIWLNVAERFISEIALNQRCVVTLDAWPSDSFQGTIFELSPTLDAVARTMLVKLSVENTGGKLKAGMFAKVRIITASKPNAVKIPASALISRNGEQYVFVVDRTDPNAPVAQKRIVVPGISIDGVLEVTQGLSPNEEFVAEGQTILADGSRINVINKIAPLDAN